MSTPESKTQTLREALKRVPTDLLRDELKRRQIAPADICTLVANEWKVSRKRLLDPQDARHDISEPRACAVALFQEVRHHRQPVIAKMFRRNSRTISAWTARHRRLLEKPAYAARYSLLSEQAA